jgi:formate dehydrogenase major subunit
MTKEKLNIILNGNAVEGFKGETILDLARRHGIEIPTLCHDPRLDPYSSCFVCVVEVEGMKGLQPSCSTKINEGMKIVTDNKKVHSGRKASLDLLLSNHYADCVAPCKDTCPAGVDVQGYISLIEKGQYSEAIALIKQTNPLPAICGRVCVRPCEVACRRNLLDEGTGVGIDYMKRFAADFDLASDNHFKPFVDAPTGKKVAIIGAGPGGLSSAYFLQQKGHQCDIFEAAPHPGGWLRYGIPEYRLPNDLLDKEIETITELGSNLYLNKKLGDNISYKEIKEKYDATILTIGSQKGTLLGCEGEDAENVFSGIDFLKNMEMTGQHYDFSGKTIAVVGGGNTAMDCCRTSIRCGAEKVYVIYRRTEAEMPANPIEIHESKLEGVEYLFLTNPKLVNKDEKGVLKSVTCLKMELGEPDASGRRRPVPVEGSDFDIEVNYILAAIGQKTDVNFIDDINKNTDQGELRVNRWGDIDADAKTLQTSVNNIFAAGDGVSGPATIIEAIAQAQKATLSCHQYLSGQEIRPEKNEFISKKDNFKKQINEDYLGKFQHQTREEMPVLDPDQRFNFEEVELGYDGETTALKESQRCLECGCTEYYTCDLKKYASEYEVDQVKFAGDYNEYNVNFNHPFIEIDNNKCILCSRCVRICKEVVGANALGLINRGYDTFVAPSMGKDLLDTNCESCGMCISACPTGAITENAPFKPGPIELDSFETICNYCSVGCKITIHHKNGFVWKVTGAEGISNPEGNICRYAKFGYHYLNRNDRITQPLLKQEGKYIPISFEKAFELIKDKISNAKPDENAFYAGARLANEEQYMIQKIARLGAGTNNINSFHYLYGGDGFFFNSRSNVPFDQLKKASKIILLGSEIHNDNAVVGFIVNNQHETDGTPVTFINKNAESKLVHKADEVIEVKSYFFFVKALNHYLLKNNKENEFFIKDNTVGFKNYKDYVLHEDYDELIEKAGVCKSCLEEFADDYNKQMNAIIIYSENELTPNTCYSIFNLAMFTGKLGKTANGLISLKTKNNSHGLIDMGINPKYGVGTKSIENPDYVKTLMEKWSTKSIPEPIPTNHLKLLETGQIKNAFIFGEDPIGCAIDKKEVDEWFDKFNFIVVQDYFMTETAEKADLILPASLPIETGGSYTNSQKIIQEYEANLPKKIEKDNIEQYIDLLKLFGSNGIGNINDIRNEIISLLPQDTSNKKFNFFITDHDSNKRFFNHGCDIITKRFNEKFDVALTNKK